MNPIPEIIIVPAARMRKAWNMLPLVLLFLCMVNKAGAQEYYLPKTGYQPQQQQATSRVSFSISAGAGVPLGDFGSENVKGSFWDFNSPDSTRLQGFAMSGFHFDIALWYKINDFLGAEIYYGGNVNSVDINGFSNTMGYISTTTQTSYYTPEYLIGPYYYFQVGNKFTCKLSAMIGLVTNTYPTFSLKVNDTTTYTRTLNSGGSGFAYSFGTQLEYAVTPRTSLYMNVTYTGANIYYPGWEEDLTAVGKYYIYNARVHHPNDITFMNTGILKISAGIIFSL